MNMNNMINCINNLIKSKSADLNQCAFCKEKPTILFKVTPMTEEVSFMLYHPCKNPDKAPALEYKLTTKTTVSKINNNLNVVNEILDHLIVSWNKDVFTECQR